MLPAFIQAAGVWYFVALGAVFAAAAAKNAAAARSPEEDHARSGADALFWLISLLGWGALVFHGVVVAASRGGVAWTLATLPLAAMICGALAGGLIGAGARAPVMRNVGRGLALAALALAAWAAAPSVLALLGR
jgi:hypothetical protein